LHAHPNGVCFQVDQITDVDDWRSVVGWGQFEEVADTWERQEVLQWFGQALIRGPLRDHQNIGRAGALGVGETVYRLRLTELSGKADGR
ncbi:MAG: pyridoxamine 5'-phosphate oxidase family protein, partial [Chloroflexota bacterium]